MERVKLSVRDRVIHAGKPEWGVGQVVSVSPASQDGETAQRVTVRFDRAGLKTLSTAHAALRLAGEGESAPGNGSNGGAAASGGGGSGASGASGGGWLEALEKGGSSESMSRLPDEATDPFRSLESRLRFTLALYRFTSSGAPLIDWAVIQSGLSDPLSRFNRQELEQMYRAFEVERSSHLKRLLTDARRAEPGLALRLLGAAPAAAREAVRRIEGVG